MQGSICTASPSDDRPFGDVKQNTEARFQALGLLVLATFTGLFWSVLLGAIFWLLDSPLSWNAMLSIGIVIAGVIAVFAAPILARRDEPLASMEEAMTESTAHK